MIKPKALFLCTGNSRRTQMAEGFLRAMAGDRFDALSAVSEETPIDPDAVAVMREVGVDIIWQNFAGTLAAFGLLCPLLAAFIHANF